MRIYLGNLPAETTPDELRRLLEPFGRVDAVSIVGAEDPWRRKRFGFAVMPDDGEAGRAIAGLNGLEYRGYKLEVSEAAARTSPSKEPESRPPDEKRKSRRRQRRHRRDRPPEAQ